MSKLSPAKVKFRKWHKVRKIRGKANTCNTIAFGDFGLQSLTPGFLTASQIEAARVAINRHLKRKGKMWARVFPQIPVTKKPAETRMGKGKGPVEFWGIDVRPGTMIFEVAGIPAPLAREALRLADSKLPVQCRFLSREELEAY